MSRTVAFGRDVLGAPDVDIEVNWESLTWALRYMVPKMDIINNTFMGIININLISYGNDDFFKCEF